MSVAENIAFRTFDKAPEANLGWWLKPSVMKNRAAGLIERYRVKTPSTDTPIENLSGGNVQRAILARELSHDVDMLIVANPCFGLDFRLRRRNPRPDHRPAQQRRGGASGLRGSRRNPRAVGPVAVMSEGKVTYVSPIGETDRNTIGTYMAGH
jgi:ABC-type uncharacterized transport system ATPase subunit